MNAVVLQHPNVNAPRPSSRISTQVRRMQADALWITLAKDGWEVPAAYDYMGDDVLVRLRAGERVAWRLA